jgi:MYXO-CTERM domain-containing protein
MAAPPTGRLEQAIVAGAADSEDPGVVQWVAHAPGKPGAFLCTAEVISPHVVLTAGHCVSTQNVDPGSQYFIIPNAANTLGAPASARIQMDEAYAAPGYKGDIDSITNAGLDIAVGIVHTPLTIPPVSYNRMPLPQSYVKQTVRIVGYGVTSGSDVKTGSSVGTRREGVETLAAIENLFLYFSGSANITCEGDSGGPAFLKIAGKESIVGITSTGGNTCNPPDGAQDTNVATYASFIDPYVNQWDPPQHPGNPGDPCTTNLDCASSICGSDGGKSFCTTTCDPGAKNSCPMGLACTDIDGQTFCAQPRKGGCDVGDGAPAGPAALLLVVAALGLVRRRFTR